MQTSNNQTTKSPDTTALEQIEATAWADFYRAAPAKTARELGIQVFDDPGLITSIQAESDVLALNRIVGAGVSGPINRKYLKVAVERYRQGGAPRFFIQIPPDRLDDRARTALTKSGFTYRNDWSKLYCRTNQPADPTGEFDIREIDRTHASAFGSIFATAVDWPPAAADWIGGLVERPHWRCYLAFAGDTPAASAAIYVAGEYASIGFAATAPDFRGRGAQSQLIARRLHDAAEEGVKWTVVEAAPPSAHHAGQSYKNLLRLGFTEAYRRPNFVYTF